MQKTMALITTCVWLVAGAAFAVDGGEGTSGACGGTPEQTAPKDVSFAAQCDGKEQKYVLMFPQAFNSEKPHDVLIALHGLGSDRQQFVTDGRDECRAARDFAAEYEMLYVSPDYRAVASWMGPKAEADVVQIIADLKRTYRVSRVFLCGASMGGAASLTFAVLHPELIDGVASMNGTANLLEYENFQDTIREAFGGSKKDVPLEYKKRSAEFWPEKLTMPVGLTVSGKDAVVPPQSVLRLAEALKVRGGKVLLIDRKEMGHSTKYADAKESLAFILKSARPKTTTDGREEASPSAGTVKSRESNVISSVESKGNETLSGFYARLSNCVGPADAPIVVGLRVNGALRQESVTIPVYGAPLNQYTRQNGRVFPPLDVAQEYRIALAEPLALKAGDKLNLEIISSGTMTGGVTAGLQFQGAWNLADMREPFRQTKTAGPVSRIAWSDREVVGTGTEKKFDPMCAAQNNSTIVGDPDGTLWQFTAFYSVDEQYGGGRAGSYARIFGFKKPLGKAWEPIGLVVDCPPQTTYAGDPFAFLDMDGTPCLAYGVVDGSNGFADWKNSWGYVRRSKTKSFAGPWGYALALWEKFPRSEGADAGGGRMVCVRVYPRPQTRDYLLCWNHGESDIKIRGAIVPRLGSPLSHKTIVESPILVRNQEEGSGGFIHDGKGYLGGWQIPSINDVTAIQRLHEFDLADPLNPQNWRVAPGSWGFNDGSNPVEDGGASADSWSLSLVGDELWASSIVYSMSEKRNSILACHVPWEKRLGNSFRFGVSRTPGFTEVAPVIEYALGKKCGLRAEITGRGGQAWAYLFLSPSARPLHRGGFAVEVSPQGSRLVWYPLEGTAIGLTSYDGPKWTAGTTYKLALQRDNDTISGTVDGFRLGPATITDPAQKQLLAEPQRFKFYGWQGGLYTIQNAILQDGQP